jgi:hypothetical protein
MRVQRVVMPGSGRESWTLLGDDLRPVAPVERFLAYLAASEKSPNTVKAYAHDLKDWWAYLGGHRLDWQSVTLEDVAGFVAWLRLPPEAMRRQGGDGSMEATAAGRSPSGPKLGLTVQVVAKLARQVGFQVLPRRWVVERTFSWINRCRRTVRDYERLPQHHAAMVQWAMVIIMTRRLARHHNRKPTPTARGA